MYSEILTQIKNYDTIVIARHIGVDPDALCSQLALRDAIRYTYPHKKVLAIGTGSSKFLAIGRLDKLEKVEQALLIVCDTPDQKRIDSVNVDDFEYSIKIDHHPFVEKFCDYEFIDSSKTSVCEIIIDFLLNTELKCNSTISELLYIGLVSDSNRFLFNSCTSNTFQLVSRLLELYPFDLSKAYEKLYLRPVNEMRLEGYISLNMTVTEHNLGYVVIRDETLKQLNVDSASPGNMINNFNYIREILVWATITEDVKNNQFRISIRSRGPEINHVAERMNGGGHRYASGVKTKTLEDALAVMRELDLELERYKKRLSEEK